MADHKQPDEHTPAPTGGSSTADDKTYTQAELDAKAAEIRRSYENKYGDYGDLKKTVDELLKEKEERKLSEMKEVDQLKAKLEQQNQQLETLGQFKTNWEKLEEEQSEKAEKLMEEKKISEADQAWIRKLPAVDRIAAINSLSATSEKKGVWAGQRTPPGAIKSASEIEEMRRNGDPNWKAEYAKLRESKR